MAGATVGVGARARVAFGRGVASAARVGWATAVTGAPTAASWPVDVAGSGAPQPAAAKAAVMATALANARRTGDMLGS